MSSFKTHVREEGATKQFYVLAPDAVLPGVVLETAAEEYDSAVLRQITLLDGTVYHIVKLSPRYC